MSQIVKQDTGNDVATAEQTRDVAIFTPRFDICESDEELVLYGDLPGVAPEDLDIRFEQGELTIHGHVAPRQKNVQYVYGEYGMGDFYRSFTVGESIDSEKISAELKGGVLTLHLPKTDVARPRRIQVTAE